MAEERDDIADAGRDGNAPLVVLPSPNTSAISGSVEGVAGAVAPIFPQPLLSPEGRDPDSLAVRVEQALDDDGRFGGFLSGLRVLTDDDGTVHLSGSIPSEGQRHSLLAVLQDIPGVTQIDDHLQIGSTLSRP